MPDAPPDLEAEIAREVARAGLTKDKLGPVLAAFLRGVREVRQGAERARVPQTPEERRDAARLLVRETGREFVRTRRWFVAAVVAGSFTAGGLMVAAAWWAAPVRYGSAVLDAETAALLVANGGTLAPALRAGRRGQAGGGEVVDIRAWVKPPVPGGRQ